MYHDDKSAVRRYRGSQYKTIKPKTPSSKPNNDALGSMRSLEDSGGKGTPVPKDDADASMLDLNPISPRPPVPSVGVGVGSINKVERVRSDISVNTLVDVKCTEYGVDTGGHAVADRVHVEQLSSGLYVKGGASEG